ncbi:MAG TPA: cation:proton antiporter [Bacteroidales bacterium]|nr:cation:proton antiporter [Bacteroidales bacterium]
MNTIIIVLCVLLLLGFLGEISSDRTRIPTVILLLFMGWLVRQATILLKISIPDLNPILPFFGSIGLILIVLEGTLELRINRSKIGVIRKSFFMAVLSMIFLSSLFAMVFSYVAEVPFRTAMVNALPFAVISSSIAIPSAKNISDSDREFVIYESSLSDIIGVLFFNFIIVTKAFTLASAGLFLLQIILISLISVFSVIGLSYILGRIKNHITYTPIILLVILVYFVAKLFDLSGLVFIMVLGLFLGNIPEIRNFYLLERLVRRVDSDRLDDEVEKFRIITIEATFLIRSLFFLLFGYLMGTGEFLNLQTLPWAFGIVIFIFGSRWLFLKLLRLPLSPLVYFSPRGLITILLFISVGTDMSINFVNNSLLVQVVVLSVLTMTSGLMRYKSS